MKKVMIGILILIPIIILLIVIAVTSFLRVNAWIAVDSIKLVEKHTKNDIDNVTVIFPSEERVRDFNDFVDILVYPDYANRYSVEWRITDLTCMDAVYEKSYQDYLAAVEVHNAYLAKVAEIEGKLRTLNEEKEKAPAELEKRIEDVKNDLTLDDVERARRIAQLNAQAKEEENERNNKIKALQNEKAGLVEPELWDFAPPATFVDENGKPVTTNTTGKFVVNTYCSFTVVVQAENSHDTLYVTAEGYNVKSITITNLEGDDNTLLVGESMRLDAKYNPLSSIVPDTKWHSGNAAIVSVDGNGVITAHGVGTTTIWVEANSRDNEDEYVASEKYTVEVKAGVSKFGTAFSTAKSSFTLAEIGLGLNDVKEFSGCAVGGGVVNMTGDSAIIVTDKGTINITKCDSGSISIQNANIYDDSNGYVFAVGDTPLTLTAVWTDVLKDGTPDGATWETSNSKIATVENGVVKAVASGYVDITATKDGKKATVKLNVQVKLVSMQLRTSNTHFAVGLARETVFAAEKYVDDTYTTKTVNSLYIEIIGEPKRTDDDTPDSYNSKLRAFYNTFNYEIIEGGEFAYFENSNENVTLFPNKLVFKPSALEGKGKQKIVVKVSAKYPKYESETAYTTEIVNINVIYGVEVNNIAELRAASEYQREYANAEDNLIARELKWEHSNVVNGHTDRYRVYNSEYSKMIYGICVMADLEFEEGLTITDDNDIKIYGDLYGNGHRLSAERNQVNNTSAMLWVAWSNVTVSNLNIRANKLEKDGMLSATDTDGLTGECFQVFTTNEYPQNRIVNILIEYSIFENAKRAGQTYSADVTFKGTLMRNILSTALYVPARMKSYIDTDGGWTIGPVYSHINMHNCVYSNCVSTIGSYSYERFTVMPKTGHWDEGHWDNPINDYTAGQGRFVRDDLAANEAYFLEHFYKDGINNQIRQTGFLDIYNWQDTSSTNIIDVGDKKTNDLIGNAAGLLIGSNSLFEQIRYRDEVEGKWYVHMGIISTGISFGESEGRIMDEPVYLDINFEDNRFAPVVETQKIKNEGQYLLENAIREFSIKFYCYSNKANITPYSVYEINDEFINRLHS